MSAILDQITVGPELPIHEVIHVLNRGGLQIVLVVDPASRRLVGIVTDYDIRQALLRHTEFAGPIGTIMQADPIVGTADMDMAQSDAFMRERRIAQLPLLDEAGRVVEIRFDQSFRDLNALTAQTIAVVMAGGLGVRLLPLTSTTPKPLLQVGDRPIIFSLLDQLLFEGFGRIYVTVNYKSDMIINAISSHERYRDRVQFVTETTALGTAGSLGLLPERPRYPFVVMNADLLTNLSLKAMLRCHGTDGNMVTVAIKRETTVIPYGVADLDGSRITAIQEKPSHSYFINTGVYVVDPKVLDIVQPDVKIDMPDVVAAMIGAQQRVGSFPVHEYWLDIGSHEHYTRAQEDHELIFSGDVPR